MTPKDLGVDTAPRIQVTMMAKESNNNVCFQVVDVSDPPVREAGTVQADVDELVKYSTSVFRVLIHSKC